MYIIFFESEKKLNKSLSFRTESVVMNKAILVHGFNKDSRDMEQLKIHLTLLGYECVLKDFPITYKEFDRAAVILEEVIKNSVNGTEKINLIGHSTGGLVIRKLLSETEYIDKINRCVLIATPNKGSSLAAIASKIKPFTSIYKTLKSLTYEYIEQLNLNHRSNVEVGAIAGNVSKLYLGKLMSVVNDGRVEVSSVYYPELKDFIILPYGHKEIHDQQETAKLIDAFLQTGKFKNSVPGT